MMAVALILAAILLVGAGILFAISPGRPAPLRDAAGQVIAGSLSERVTVDIGGIPQGMVIQSVDPANPVLLFLHGGPGMTEFFMETTYPTGLERHFTMVWWEQRGAGMSFSGDIPPESMTMDQMIADTVEVADYLRKRFGQDRILLLGHSWGSYLGIQVAAAAPERFLAYVGMAQITYQLRSEVMAHAYMTDAYRERGDDAMVRRLIAAPVSMADGLSPAYMRLRDRAMHGLGVGQTRDMRSVVTGIFLPVWRVDAYTVMDKINVWRGKLWSRPFFWEDLLRDDLRARLTDFDLPVYFLVGRHDYTSNKDLSRAYFDRIDAPVKGFYLFEDSAHSPLFEEPAKGNRDPFGGCASRVECAGRWPLRPRAAARNPRQMRSDRDLWRHDNLGLPIAAVCGQRSGKIRVGKEGVDRGQGRDARRRRAPEFGLVGDQKRLAGLGDDRLADAHLLDVEIQDVAFGVHRRTADHRDVELELADRRYRQASDQPAIGASQGAAGQDDLALAVGRQDVGDIHVVGYDHQVAVVQQFAGHRLCRRADVQEQRTAIRDPGGAGARDGGFDPLVQNAAFIIKDVSGA